MTALAQASFELKDAADDEPADIVTKALDDLRAANDERLAKLEKKSAERFDRIEQRLSRPNLANDNRTDEPSLERKAFVGFLRGMGNVAHLEELERKALTVGTDAAAGYVFAPEDTTREFIRNLVEWSPVRGVADVRSTVSHTVTIPKRLTVTNAAWTGEAVTSTASEPTFGEISMPIRELTTHVDVGAWLLEDAIENVEAEVRLALAEDFGKKEATAFVNGTGALQPEGFMTNVSVPQALNGHATVLSADALISMMYSLPAAYRNRGTWAMNSTTLATIRKLKNTAGDYLWQPAYAAGQPETILGRPVVEMIDLGDPIANAFPVVFGDFKASYRIYDRIELSVKPNPYLLATEGKVRFHARRRLGAAVVRAEALRKLKMAVS